MYPVQRFNIIESGGTTRAQGVGSDNPSLSPGVNCMYSMNVLNRRMIAAIELLSNVVDGKVSGGGFLGFDSVDKRNFLNHVG
jgi:hypothetical protein